MNSSACVPVDTVKVRTAVDVAQWRLCIGCGACTYACPEKKLSLVDVLAEGLRPVLDASKSSACGSCTDCVTVCPGVGIAHVPPALTTAPVAASATADPVRTDAGFINELTQSWGPVLEVWEGHAADAELRLGGSSGGLSSALALYCIERLGMHGLLHVAADTETRTTNRTAFSHRRADILAATGSKYAPASPCDQLQLIEDAGGPCVFIGKPCDVQGLRKAQAMRPQLDANVGLAIGIFCAGTPSTQGTIDLLRLHGVDPAAVAELRYRGRGWPGTFAVRMKDGGQWRDLATYAEAWGFLQKYRPYRCHLCPDGTSEFADIACGDPWYRDIEAGEAGLSLVVVRTARGRDIVRGAIAAGYVALMPVNPTVLQRSQKELQYKRGAIWGRLLTMKALGVAAPRFQGFSLFQNWLRIPRQQQLRSLIGTARRIVMRGYRLPLRQPK